MRIEKTQKEVTIETNFGRVTFQGEVVRNYNLQLDDAPSAQIIYRDRSCLKDDVKQQLEVRIFTSPEEWISILTYEPIIKIYDLLAKVGIRVTKVSRPNSGLREYRATPFSHDGQYLIFVAKSKESDIPSFAIIIKDFRSLIEIFDGEGPCIAEIEELNNGDLDTDKRDNQNSV